MGRHCEAQIHAIGKRDITALAGFMGDKPYFMGTEPCLIDARSYGFLANIDWPRWGRH